MKNKKRILISGGNGYIGSYLKNYAIINDYEVFTIGKSSSNDYQVDLSKDSIFLTENFDLIIHTAGIIHDSKHANQIVPSLFLEDLNISLNFLKSITKIEYKKIIFLSSIAVYGLDEGINININTTAKPKSGYGLVKLACERLLSSTIESSRLLILRLPLVIGNNPKGNLKKLTNALESGYMILPKHNKSTKSVIYLEDLIHIIYKMSENLTGIHQFKSKDILFNNFIQGLTSKKILCYPFLLHRIALKTFKLFGPFRLYTLLNKISTTLTIESTIGIPIKTEK